LPPLVASTKTVAMTVKERRTYDSLKKDLVVSVGDTEIDAVSAAALSNKLLQMAGGAVYDGEGQHHVIHAQKLDALEDLVESANGKPVLVAYWFKHEAERIKERLKVREIKTSQDIDDWNAGKISVALIHPASAGHGLNLQEGGSILIWFSLTWSLELYQQTNARLYRQGQKDTVSIIHIITEGTIDEDVMKALERKDKTQTALVDAVKANLGG
ncbi:MAG: DEAD/DEAH box helicase, partial [Selenomonas sp.]|nr:DEAD/DEAH box helicase [Selenomonas sp.]